MPRKTAPLSKKESPVRYNLGCGEVQLDGWTNIDYSHAPETADLGVFPWPWKGATVDEILASHVLEHFTKAQAKQFIGECWRILKPGGVLHVAVPDMDIFIDARLTGDWSKLDGYYWRSLDWFMGGDEKEADLKMRHRYMYNWETLAFMLTEAGFAVTRRQEALDIDTLRYSHISLYVDAVKADETGNG